MKWPVAVTDGPVLQCSALQILKPRGGRRVSEHRDPPGWIHIGRASLAVCQRLTSGSRGGGVSHLCCAAGARGDPRYWIVEVWIILFGSLRIPKDVSGSPPPRGIAQLPA